MLIGAVTYEACFEPLKKEGYHVVNQQMINHPARGGQLLFRNKLRKMLDRIGRMQSTSL